MEWDEEDKNYGNKLNDNYSPFSKEDNLIHTTTTTTENIPPYKYSKLSGMLKLWKLLLYLKENTE